MDLPGSASLVLQLQGQHLPFTHGSWELHPGPNASIISTLDLGYLSSQGGLFAVLTYS